MRCTPESEAFDTPKLTMIGPQPRGDLPTHRRVGNMSRQRAACLLGCLCAVSLASTARSTAAQARLVDEDTGMDAHLFRPAVDSKGYISVNGTNILGDGDYSFGLVLDMGFGIMPYDGFEYERLDLVTFDDDGV